jgi:hypothetical protein
VTSTTARRRLGPMSSTVSSPVARLSSSRVSQVRADRRPVATTAAPRWSDAATFSTTSPHAEAGSGARPNGRRGAAGGRVGVLEVLSRPKGRLLHWPDLVRSSRPNPRRLPRRAPSRRVPCTNTGRGPAPTFPDGKPTRSPGRAASEHRKRCGSAALHSPDSRGRWSSNSRSHAFTAAKSRSVRPSAASTVWSIAAPG